MKGIEKQQAPFTLEIEPTEGCNLGCNFCGLRGIRENGKKPWKYMEFETFKKIIDDVKKIKWTTKIVFAGHGEPTLNVNLLQMLEYARKTLPTQRLFVISNGYGIVNSDSGITNFIEKLKQLKVGLILDNYSENGDWHRIIDNVDNNEYNVEFFNKKSKLFDENKKFRILVYPLQVDTKKKLMRKMSNHCGAAAPLDFSHVNKRCAKPFRELFIRWDGNVALCCDDFRGEYYISNTKEQFLEDIWNHERFVAARIMLYNYSREFKPCYGCNCISMSPALLPDQLGKKELPSITDEIKKISTKFYKPLNTIIKRNWENNMENKKFLICQPHSDDAILSCASIILNEDNDVRILTVENNIKRKEEDKELYCFLEIPVEFINVKNFIDESYYGYFQSTKDVDDNKMIDFIVDSYKDLIIEIEKELVKKIEKYKKEGYQIVVPLGVGHPFHFFISMILRDYADIFYREFPHSYKKRSAKKMQEIKTSFILFDKNSDEEIHNIKFDLAKRFYKSQSGFFWFEQGYINKKLAEEFYHKQEN